MTRGPQRPKPPGPPSIPPQLRIALDHIRAGRLEPAAEILRLYLRRCPDDHNAQFLLGNVLSQQLKDEPAIYALERAASMRPDDPQRWLAVGVALLRGRGAAAAEPVLRASPAAKAGDPSVLTLLGEVLATLSRAGEAVPILEGVLAKHPRHVSALRTLAKTFTTAGRTDEAVELFRRSAQDSDFRNLATYCFHANYSGTMSPQELFATHQRFYEVVKNLAPAGSPLPRTKRDGPLRVGLLSADFQQHSVAYFVEPLLDHLDKDEFRAICLTASTVADDVTARLRSKAGEWVDASSPEPPGMVEAIRRAKPDVLIDLGGLTGPARVVAFANRIAPVQATYLGYPNTSAVPNVDWRLVDSWTDPTEPYPDGLRADDLATEKLLRIEGCFICYRPPDDAPPVSRRPTDVPIAFGSFNTSNKMSPQCVALWSRVLERVPGSALVLKRKEFADPWIADQFKQSFAARGIDPSRLRFLGKTPSVAEHLRAYAEVDIALDTFPYHGTTTTCEALWMGVPVVTLVGRTHASRVGLSLLRAAGLPDHAASFPDDFVQKAASLAEDRAALAALRSSLRPTVAASMLCDGRGFARRFGAALRSMWQFA